MLAHEHAAGICDIQIGIFNFIDTVYRQALFVTFACCEHGVGQREQWTSLTEQQFLTYFRMNAPEEGKEFLREKFREEPQIKDRYARLQFAAMTHHFHTIFGLGPSPDWTGQSSLKSAPLLNISPLVDRLIRQAIIIPEERAAHIRALNAADYAEKTGAVASLEEGDYKEAGRLIVEGMVRANDRNQPISCPATLTLP